MKAESISERSALLGGPFMIAAVAVEGDDRGRSGDRPQRGIQQGIVDFNRVHCGGVTIRAALIFVQQPSTTHGRGLTGGPFLTH